MDVADGLESLADKSLVRIEPVDADAPAADEETRFGLHPLLREYALERLDESGELAAIEARHAAVMTELAERLGAGHPDRRPARRTCATSTARSTTSAPRSTWSLEPTRTPTSASGSMGSTWRWYQQRGRLREGRAIAGGAPGPADRATSRVRIAGLAADGGLAYWMDDIPGRTGGLRGAPGARGDDRRSGA